MRAGGRRCSPGSGEEGSRPAGEVGGGSGSGCVCSRGGGGACARLSPLSSCHRRRRLLQRSPAWGERSAARPPRRRRLAPGRGPARSRRPGPRFPASCELVLHAAGRIRPRAAGDPRLSLTPSGHFRGSPGLPGCSFLESLTRGERPDRCLCVSGKERCLPPCPPAAAGVDAWAIPAGGRGGGGPRSPLPALPPHPPGEVCLPPLPGWRKCASGQRVAGAPAWCLVPAGPGQVVGDALHGVLEQPGNPAFCNAG